MLHIIDNTIQAIYHHRNYTALADIDLLSVHIFGDLSVKTDKVSETLQFLYFRHWMMDNT
jgi:hypothetical protein